MSILLNRGITSLGYYIRNKKLALSYGNGESPDFSEADGILVEYTTVDMSSITEETSEVTLSDIEKKVVVAYMKKKYFELLGNIKLVDYYENQFMKYLSKAVKVYNPSPRVVTHTGPTALK